MLLYSHKTFTQRISLLFDKIYWTYSTRLYVADACTRRTDEFRTHRKTFPGTHQMFPCTICPRSSDPFYKVSYYIKWVTTSWTHSTSQMFSGTYQVLETKFRIHLLVESRFGLYLNLPTSNRHYSCRHKILC